MIRKKRDVLFEGRVFTLARHVYAAEDGSEITREMIEHPGAVAVLPMIGKEEVLLVEQYRAGAGRSLLEIPAGMLERGEDPRACAMRELEEETGYKAGKLENLFNIYTSPGILTEQMYVFLASDLTPGQTNTDDDEHITLRRWSFRDLRLQLRSGNIKDAKTLAALTYVLAFKPWLGGDGPKPGSQ